MALKVMSSRFLLWELYNFDIRGSAGILLVLDGRNSCTGDKGSGLVLVF
jgi:hypothetical protein